MFRLTRPLYQALKQSTGITGLAVHPDPLPALIKTYESTLTSLEALPASSVYRQGVEALTLNKLKLVKAANGDVAKAEAALDEGQIEEAIDIASDELKLTSKMLEWKACVTSLRSLVAMLKSICLYRWEPLEEKPEPGQWEYAAEYHSS